MHEPAVEHFRQDIKAIYSLDITER